MQTRILWFLIVPLFIIHCGQEQDFELKYSAEVAKLESAFTDADNLDEQMKIRESAQKLYDQMLHDYRTNPNGHGIMGDLAVLMGEYGKAGEVYSRLIETPLDQAPDSLLLLVAKNYIYADMYSKGHPYLLASMQGDQDIWVKDRLARAYADHLVDQGEREKAITFLQTAERKLQDHDIPRIRGRLTVLQMIDKPAPELDIVQWYTSKPNARVQILEFWASWCPPCREILPILDTVYETFQDRNDFDILAVTKLYGFYADQNKRIQNPTPEEERNLIYQYVQSKNLSYALALVSQETFQAYGVNSVPTLFILKDGNVKNVWYGIPEQGATELVRQIEKLLES
ncbi:redoxin domain-containing protein [candidate division KSB1 bacterium]|jgi:thiol-disulfide isomerase/thioredoxin|nr:redoxin domain-containing protein [candidate division KSB1 bacterium]